MSHAPRINLFTLAPANLKAMINLSMTNKKGALGERLVELVQLRVSLVNGCGVCINPLAGDPLMDGNHHGDREVGTN